MKEAKYSIEDMNESIQISISTTSASQHLEENTTFNWEPAMTLIQSNSRKDLKIQYFCSNHIFQNISRCWRGWDPAFCSCCAVPGKHSWMKSSSSRFLWEFCNCPQATAASSRHSKVISFLSPVLSKIEVIWYFSEIILHSWKTSNTHPWNSIKFPAELDTETETAVGCCL